MFNERGKILDLLFFFHPVTPIGVVYLGELENDIRVTSEGGRGEGVSKASLTFRVFNDATDPCHNKPSTKGISL